MQRFINYIQHTLKHKFSFWSIKNLKSKLIEYGPTFLFILIIVELIEHLGLPILFYYLGANVHDFFYVLIPAPLLICLHFITAPIVFFIYVYFIKKKKRIILSDFYKNILKLFTSISIAQLIPIVATPILTQYFSPSEFGVYGLYISICSIFGLIATGKYDTAIMLPKRKIDSINLLALSLLIACLFSTFLLSILNLFNDTFLELTKSTLLQQYYFIIPITVFLIAANQSITAWFNRNKKYNIIANQNILKSSSNSITALLLGLKNINAGLIFGHITSITMISMWNVKYLFTNLDTSLISSKIMHKNFKRHLNFLKFSTISTLFNSCANIGMTTLIIIFFGPKIAGLYFLAEKIIAIPISFITNSVSQVYFQKASILFHSNKLALLELTNKIQKNIFYLIFPFLIICTLWGEQIFSILGHEWREAGIILKYFTGFILLKNIYAPISHIVDILHKQKIELIFNISLFVFQLGSFYFLKQYNDIKVVLLTASFFGAIHYLIMNIYVKKELSKLA